MVRRGVWKADFRCFDLQFTTNKWRHRDSLLRGFREKLQLWANGVHSGVRTFSRDTRLLRVVWHRLKDSSAQTYAFFVWHTVESVSFWTTKCLCRLWRRLLSWAVFPPSICRSSALLLQIQRKLLSYFWVRVRVRILLGFCASECRRRQISTFVLKTFSSKIVLNHFPQTRLLSTLLAPCDTLCRLTVVCAPHMHTPTHTNSWSKVQQSTSTKALYV